jgi:hypothetical protein
MFSPPCSDEKNYLQIPKLDGGMTLNSIVAFGDSGCRGQFASKPTNRQLCRPGTWPFNSIAEDAATGADGLGAVPDLVIHLGDYLYRLDESWEVWNEEFFKPARPLLEAVPWVMLPGNHEACSWPEKDHPGSGGWFLFLDLEPGAQIRSCPGKAPFFFPPAALDLDDTLRLIMLDSAHVYASSEDTNDRLKHYKSMFKRVVALAQEGEEKWLLTHVPFWGLTREGPLVKYAAESERFVTSAKDQWDRADGINLVLSGDLHFFQSVRVLDEHRLPISVGDGTAGGAGRWGCGASGAGQMSTSRTG